MPKLRLTREIGFNRQGTEISLHQDFYVGAHRGVSPFFLFYVWYPEFILGIRIWSAPTVLAPIGYWKISGNHRGAVRVL